MSDSLKIPNLAGVITKADVDTKGTGSYAASYVNWAKVAHLLHEHAPGWDFHLRPALDGALLHKAPDGTAFVVGEFIGPDDERLASFPFPCMDNRNNPIQLDKVSARILTDTHRRAMCACAAFSFGLAYELWAKDPVEDPHREEPVAPPAKASSKAPAKAAAKPAPAAPASEPALLVAEQQTTEAQPITEDERQLCIQLLKDMAQSDRNALIVAYKDYFNLPDDALITQYLTTTAHRDFIQHQLAA